MALSILNPSAVGDMMNQAQRAVYKARNALSERLTERSSTFAVESQEVLFLASRQVRCPADLEKLEITLSNNSFGPGVVVSSVGAGNAATSGILVGDVITDINGQSIASHEQAIEVLRSITCRDFVFSLAGTPRAVVLDRANMGRVEISLTNVKKAPGVEVETVGLLGLAASAGVRVGDVILAVNGVLVSDHAETIAMIDTTERFIELTLAPTEYDDRV